MANEATKTDLANLEKKLNTKLQNLVDSTNKALTAETAENNKIIEGVNKAIATLNTNIASLDKQIADLRTVVNQHAKVINEK